MLFNSYFFIFCFLPLCLIVYYLLNRCGKCRLAMASVVLFSFWFYASDNLYYLTIFIFSICFNWAISGVIRKRNDVVKKILLFVGVMANIAIIYYFKYNNFVIYNINRFLATDIKITEILLPLGISFYTFQQVSYLVDAYKGETKDYKFLDYVLFVSFFPQLVAGPIVFHDEIIPQFTDKENKRVRLENICSGIYSFSVGLAKKVLLADTFGRAVTWGFDHVYDLKSPDVIIVMLSYTLQIYFDFSGYSDMAIGIARMFNVELPLNFNSPYKAYSISEFWDRWHMTLTRFLRKYVYIPLGGNRKGKVRTYVNMFLVFCLSGLWHGASFTFIVWGMLHGIALVLNRIFKKTWEKCNKVFQWFCTFLFINVTWLLFRADSVSQAIILVVKIFKLEDTAINRELYECFNISILKILNAVCKPFSLLGYHIYNFHMWFLLGIGLFICINTKNVHEEDFHISWKKLLWSSALLILSVISLSGVSTFLYFNF